MFNQFDPNSTGGWNPYPTSSDGWAGAAGEVVREVSKFGVVPLMLVIGAAFGLIAFFFVLWKFNGPATELFNARTEEAKERKRLAEERKNYFILARESLPRETEFQEECRDKLAELKKALEESSANSRENLQETIDALCNFAESLLNATTPLTGEGRAQFEAIRREILGIRQMGSRLK